MVKGEGLEPTGVDPARWNDAHFAGLTLRLIFWSDCQVQSSRPWSWSWFFAKRTMSSANVRICLSTSGP
ncbi:hypothetical protein TNCT_293121 [Trichonephila clavata]|uniref:Uncharacterized protein n=1 Tax=Trichonephila clavata TaxID=2740835 RepID=A0A8X6GZK9_TRICU|nr:hypothetical protein TNCT_293121 [Trichonephila clavata]